ncbi:DUF1934 domain-containing protein [Paenibacillus sp. GD4]|uniref:DUF1934 domain-containing protein n=1 Tax=Paenibacillus sp. GD4 TaxID=3068890 RepID=UPI00279660C1|nr:DUF1934 domain-containing protein [Paenibacillus sp. GD4]MDQ1910990.1 DUF1934 domain-containing protein [Paenibacillus sp. GD4]
MSHSDKIPVQLTIESTPEGGEPIVQRVQADLYPKEGCWYLRYNEPESAQLGRTATTMRIDREQVRILRQGDVRSEQIFVPGGKRLGYYDTPQGKLELETATGELTIGLQGAAGLGEVRWSYDLTVAGESAGRYRLRLSVSAL